jgi:tyrosinase
MERFVTTKLEVPELVDSLITRVDLIFYDVEHGGDSYEARVFFNNVAADINTPCDAANGYAGSFTVFGHGGCYGDVGHCDVPSGPRAAFDRRPPHPLTPWTKTVVVSEAVIRLATDVVDVTVVAVRPGDTGAEPSDDLRFSRIRLAAYSG